VIELQSFAAGKRLQILKEIVPNVNRVAVLQARGDPNVKFAMASLEGAAPDFRSAAVVDCRQLSQRYCCCIR
jgi:hypothetical protein